MEDSSAPPPDLAVVQPTVHILSFQVIIVIYRYRFSVRRETAAAPSGRLAFHFQGSIALSFVNMKTVAFV